ncbi:MAG: AAA family ATPase, partial [Flavobacteriaceae bacterium]|nr:AAA family ATPase [Flavobacteriaceae bacterium]
KGRVADFKNTIIIMTSNMGSHIIQEKFEHIKMAERDTITEFTKLEVLALLKQSIRPEFINRIDEIIMFTPLNEIEIREIVQLQIKGVSKLLAEKNIHLEATEDALISLAKKGFDPQYGARPVKRVIQKEVLNELSKELLSGRITQDSSILLDAFDDKLVFRNK